VSLVALPQGKQQPTYSLIPQAALTVQRYYRGHLGANEAECERRERDEAEQRLRAEVGQGLRV